MNDFAAILAAVSFLIILTGVLLFMPMEKLKPYRRTAKFITFAGGALFVGAVVMTPAEMAPNSNASTAKNGEISPQEARAKLEQMREQAANPASNTDEEMKVAREATESEQPQIPLPKFAPPPPLTAACSRIECASQQVWFARRDWPNAWRGDYQGQRNAAYCRADGCSGAVLVDRVEACAWRLVIGSMNAAKADETDVANMKMNCGKLDEATRYMAAEKAEAFIKMIRSKGR